VGPVIGAILVNGAKSALSESFPLVWQFFLGGLFVGSVLIFPAGIIGLFRGDARQLRQWLSPARAKALFNSVIGGTTKL
jgi:urea transport system permease protein